MQEKAVTHWMERPVIKRGTFPLKLIVEYLSLLTAAGFVLSAMINSVSMWMAFNINYFSVAQPSDIVMSGFIYVGAVMLVSAMVTAIFVMLGHIYKIVLLKTPIGHAFFAIVGRSPFNDKVVRLTKEQRARVIDLSLKWTNLTFVVGEFFFSCVAMIEQWSGGHFGGVNSASESFWQRPLSTTAVSNLYLATDDPQFAKCGAAPVLWLGSASAILECKGTLRVVHNTQGMILDRKNPK